MLKATRGRAIPARMLALKAMSEGLKVSIEQGLKIETDCFIEALKAPESKGTINTFFLKTMSDKPKAMIPKGFRNQTHTEIWCSWLRHDGAGDHH